MDYYAEIFCSLGLIVLTALVFAFIKGRKVIRDNDRNKVIINGKHKVDVNTFSLLAILIFLIAIVPISLKYYFQSNQINNPVNEKNNIKPDLANLDGEYYYRTTPIHNANYAPEEHDLLVDEKGNRYYQFIGKIRICADKEKTGYKVMAHRHIAISLDEDGQMKRVVFNPSPVNWSADQVYLPWGGSRVIIVLKTGASKPNQGIYMGDIKGASENNIVRNIKGPLIYLNPRNPSFKLNANWVDAYMELEKIENSSFNGFLDKAQIRKWFKSINLDVIIRDFDYRYFIRDDETEC